jgi:putative transcriptional regulator
MRGFGIKLRACVAAGLLAVLPILATAPIAQSTDLTMPSFLVATRDLQDPHFQHAVVLMVPSTEPPLLAGVIINNPAKQKVQDMFPQGRQLKGADETIYQGGPVEPDQASVIFRASSAIGSASRVFADTYIATGHDAIAGIVKDPRVADLRVILGKAQWLREQLYGEIMAGAWYVVPAKSDLVFGDPKDLWSTLVKGGDLEEAEADGVQNRWLRGADERVGARGRLLWAAQLSALNLPFSCLDGTNWQRRISSN